MDIISMQLANKVLKKLNTEYNGFMHLVVATPGQTVFNLPREYAVGQNTLNVYVDGALAYVNEDYTETNASTITFKLPLENSELVLFKTNVAGVNKYVTLNPPYDDTEVKDLISTNATDIQAANTNIEKNKSDISELKTKVSASETKIENILSVLDDDADGEIIDILSNLKSQWQEADGDLQTIIADKVGKDVFANLNSEIVEARGTFATLKERLQSLVDAITSNDSDITANKDSIDSLTTEVTGIKQSLVEVTNAITPINESIENINSQLDSIKSDINNLKANQNKLVLTDTVTGWEYNIVMTNGTLTADLVKMLSSALVKRVGTGEIHIGDTIYFTASSKYQDGSDASALSTFEYSVDDTSIANIDIASGELTAIALGNVNVKVTASIGVTKVEGVTAITVVVNKLEKVAVAKANLSLGDISAVVSDITLPTVQNDCAVSWSTSDESLISEIGLVTRPSGLIGNKEVVLTATISYETASDMKAFTATVVALDLTDLEKLGIASTNFDSTIGVIDWANLTSNINLPTKQDEADITWTAETSSFVNIITNPDNTVVAEINRPIDTEGNQQVQFTATLTVGSETQVKTYTGTIIALPPVVIE